MTDTPFRQPQPYPSFEDPPPRAIGTDALLGKVVRRLFEDASKGEEAHAGTLRAVLRMLDHRAAGAVATR